MDRLKDKVAIITGAASGMGAAHVKMFVDEGAKVVFSDIQEDKGVALQKELGDNTLFVKHDVTNEEEWSQVVKAAVDNFGTVDILVNNAGIDYPETDLADVSLDDYNKLININQTSVLLGMKAVEPIMKDRKSGSIVNISSLAGIVGVYKKVSYTGSKFAVNGMTKAAALELGEHNIRVNSVHPGFITTPMTEHLINDELEAMFPLKRAGNVEEVSYMVVFLASDESTYSTGSEFVIDGGLGAQ
ncbi:MAG TPA: glucose 1-dehydrogenase [Candidatus Jeotgalicoccus stercoravium]|nr:glucose 1-dehydrogenase [Candidatus Jeotgalicoccus stercoravium]